LIIGNAETCDRAHLESSQIRVDVVLRLGRAERGQTHSAIRRAFLVSRPTPKTRHPRFHHDDGRTRSFLDDLTQRPSTDDSELAIDLNKGTPHDLRRVDAIDGRIRANSVCVHRRLVVLATLPLHGRKMPPKKLTAAQVHLKFRRLGCTRRVIHTFVVGGIATQCDIASQPTMHEAVRCENSAMSALHVANFLR
jgi:hypothetical protein